MTSVLMDSEQHITVIAEVYCLREDLDDHGLLYTCLLLSYNPRPLNACKSSRHGFENNPLETHINTMAISELTQTQHDPMHRDSMWKPYNGKKHIKMAILGYRVGSQNCQRIIVSFVVTFTLVASLLLPLPLLDPEINSGNRHGNRITRSQERRYETWLDHLCPRNQLRNRTADRLRVTWEPPSPKSIFFTQTSCVEALTPREVSQRVSPWQVLLQLPNVRFAYLDLDAVFSEEPLRAWHRDRNWLVVEERASVVLSDALRSELLRRYGGTYIDLDAIALRPLPSGTNWIADFYEKRVNAALSSFLPGHQLFQRVVDAIPRVFNPYYCCSIGPDLVTAEMRHLCPDAFASIVTEDLQEPAVCGDITVLPISSFYPINYDLGPRGFSQLLRSGTGQEFLKNTKAYSLHLFSSITAKDKLYIGGGSILEEVAKKHCPNVFEAQRSISLIM
ncbi:uncharacterized protein LOC122264216 [Penaeus japonicus]|uniref:uncharacterized protein LOC122264216 n=1 Tax=Penaeus japonicus TaxID=27405 RepID=UPI001C7169F6|nr:uncharacterized protein LOC122264216 [Penaeus japonicus]